MSATFFLDNWKPVKEAIEKAGLKTVVKELHWDEQGGLMTPTNQPQFTTAITPEPIIVGYTKEGETPFMIIRYLDSKHNEKEELPSLVKSFICITMGVVPQCGIEQFMQICRHCKHPDGEGFCMQIQNEFGMDCGVFVTNHVVKLIEGKFDGQKVM